MVVFALAIAAIVMVVMIMVAVIIVAEWRPTEAERALADEYQRAVHDALGEPDRVGAATDPYHNGGF